MLFLENVSMFETTSFTIWREYRVFVYKEQRSWHECTHTRWSMCVCRNLTHIRYLRPPRSIRSSGHPSRKWAPVNKASGRRAAHLILDGTTNRSPADRATWSPHRLPRTFAVHGALRTLIRHPDVSMVLFFCKLTRGFVRRHNRASPRSAAAPEVTLTAPPPEVRHSCCRDAAPEEKMLPMESSKL